jgi:precorrin-6A/cobalt-precorrin-6A reductase
MKVMVMAGTSDAIRIIGNLADHHDIEVIATTTTKYGGDLAISAGADEIIVGRLGSQEIADLLEVNKIDLIVDATHPHASEATLNAIKSTHKSGIKYIRFERPSITIPKNKGVFEVSSFEEAAKKATSIIKSDLNGKIMHLAGVSTLQHMIKEIHPKLIVVRVLPMVFSVKKCIELGIPRVNIIAMQGTFSKEFNIALMKEYAIELVITKESGEIGGSPFKIEAAMSLKIPIIIVKRPKILELENEIIFKDVDDLVDNILNI